MQWCTARVKASPQLRANHSSQTPPTVNALLGGLHEIITQVALKAGALALSL